MQGFLRPVPAISDGASSGRCRRARRGRRRDELPPIPARERYRRPVGVPSREGSLTVLEVRSQRQGRLVSLGRQRDHRPDTERQIWAEPTSAIGRPRAQVFTRDPSSRARHARRPRCIPAGMGGRTEGARDWHAVTACGPNRRDFRPWGDDASPCKDAVTPSRIVRSTIDGGRSTEDTGGH